MTTPKGSVPKNTSGSERAQIQVSIERMVDAYFDSVKQSIAERVCKVLARELHEEVFRMQGDAFAHLSRVNTLYETNGLIRAAQNATRPRDWAAILKEEKMFDVPNQEGCEKIAAEMSEIRRKKLLDERRFQAACAAMQGILSCPFDAPKKYIASEAVKCADALLKELEE